MKPGISMRHGPHHVAQKSRITTFPAKSEDFTGLPSTLLSSHVGLGLEVAATFVISLAETEDFRAAVKASNTATATTAIPAKTMGLLFINANSWSWERSDPPIIPLKQTRPPRTP